MTTEMTTVYEAIKALEVNDMKTATSKATSALAMDGIGLEGRVIAAAILMVETLEDLAQLQQMEVYGDLQRFVAEHAEPEPTEVIQEITYDGQELVTMYLQNIARHEQRLISTEKLDYFISEIIAKGKFFYNKEDYKEIINNATNLSTLLAGMALNEQTYSYQIFYEGSVESILKRSEIKETKYTDVEASKVLKQAVQELIEDRVRRAKDISTDLLNGYNGNKNIILAALWIQSIAEASICYYTFAECRAADGRIAKMKKSITKLKLIA